MAFLEKIFGDANQKYLDSLQPVVNKINNLEPAFEDLSDEQLKEKTQDFKKRLEKGESLDDILPEAFALVREASKRTLEQRHYDCQLVGGIVLHEGQIAEMKTGEGKTLAATLPLYLNALEEKGCHLVTVNDYLSRRDTVWMGQIYHALGLSVGCLNHQQAFLYDPTYKQAEEEKEKIRDRLGGFHVVEDFLRPCSRKEAYAADITYGTNNEFGFDYLRDNMVYDLSQRAQREPHFAIIDEIDFILIDEARTPLIISAPDQESPKWYQDFSRIISKLTPEKDYEIDEKSRVVTITDQGVSKVENILGLQNIYAEKGSRYLHYLEQALRAQAINPADGKPLFARDRDYIVKDGEVIIIDEFTGRLMPGRRWSGGLHQAIEAKENVEVQPESITLASITFQNLFRRYDKLAGMTGTAASSAEEFDKVYDLRVIIVPTHKPVIRDDMPDKVYTSKEGKFKALIKEIKERHDKGQPLLIGTRSVEKNEHLSSLLEKEGITHEILNAKNHQREAEIIAQAGKLGAVTVATNMAGRGVDIILGGNPPDHQEAEKVKELGGLHVIGTERHEARRIDNQLRGRAGRQGDPGSSQFFLSLEDELLRIFGGDRTKALISKLDLPEDQAIEADMVSNLIRQAQAKIEGVNFDIRKRVLEYDNVMNKQREVIYKKREEVLKKAKTGELKELVFQNIEDADFSLEEYKAKRERIGAEKMSKVEKALYLKVIDTLWISHLESMKFLRDSVKLRAYGKKDPLVEYKKEGFKMFQRLISTVEKSVAKSLINIEVREAEKEQEEQVERTTSSDGEKKYIPRHSSKEKPGRNDPCPCGSGEKYKKCCIPKYG